MKHFKSKADINQFKSFLGFVEQALDGIDVPQKTVFSLMTVAEEIIINIINYAYTDEPGDLEIDFENEEQIIRFTFKDQGTPFNPMEHSEVDTSLGAHERDIGGLGIHLVKSMTDRVTYQYENGKNILAIEKKLDE